MLYQGIAARAFERRFQLADHVVVTGAVRENGLLHIDLVREVPEAQKPRSIAIHKAAKTLEAVKRPRSSCVKQRAAPGNKGAPNGALFFVYSVVCEVSGFA